MSNYESNVAKHSVENGVDLGNMLTNPRQCQSARSEMSQIRITHMNTIISVMSI